jgi:hypothetical protein
MYSSYVLGINAYSMYYAIPYASDLDHGIMWIDSEEGDE